MRADQALRPLVPASAMTTYDDRLPEKCLIRFP